ncbi:hypothetical protein NEHOM01_0750 [Nematocida homosporus]|uniref:uncharacterized protein n=1 Tax=Nematocida homosporus TaxID=1912981 RepID=UPI00222067C2|nr:uncharacterized protein NEHOM01_0750 [Nematocida homosporus]KAI5185292.1 hypothetical protein NEHOM01_0750 [Nematocida homosporus]
MQKPTLTLNMDEIAEITKYLRGSYSPPPGLSELQWHRFQKKADLFLLRENKLYYDNLEKDATGAHLLEVIGDDDIERLEKIFIAGHGKDGHLASEKLYQTLRNHYMGFSRQTIRDIASNCSICKKDPPMQHATCKYPLKHMQVDCIDMRYCMESNDGYGWILIILDICSKHLMAMEMKHKTGKAIIEILDRYFSMIPPPWIIQSGNDPEFVNDEVASFMKRLDIEHRYGRSDLRTLGQVERANQTLSRSLFKNAPHDKPTRWIDNLGDIVRAYNRRWHRAINKAPLDVVYGYPASEPRPILPEEHQKVYDQEVERMYRCELEGDSLVDPVLEWNKPVEHPTIKIVPFVATPVEERVNAKHQQRYLHTMSQSGKARNKPKKFSPGDKVLVAKEYSNNTHNNQPTDSSFSLSRTGTILCNAGRNIWLVDYKGKEVQIPQNLLLLHPNQNE